MTASKFTPGPWEVARNDVHAAQIAVIHHCRGNDWVEVWSPAAFGASEDENEANAHLIAAAPELYEALVLLMAEVDFSGNGNAKDFGWPRATEAARVALAKARGEE